MVYTSPCRTVFTGKGKTLPTNMTTLAFDVLVVWVIIYLAVFEA